MGPETVLESVNKGKHIPTIDEWTVYLTNLAGTGYDKFIGLAFYAALFACGFGLLVIIGGLVAKSSRTVRWGIGTIAGSLAAFALCILIPMILVTIKAKILPT